MEEYLSKVPEGKENQYLRGIAAMGSGDHAQAEVYFYQILSKLEEGNLKFQRFN